MLKKLCKVDKVRLNGVVLLISGKYTRTGTVTCEDLGVREGDLISWAVRIAGGARIDEQEDDDR